MESYGIVIEKEYISISNVIRNNEQQKLNNYTRGSYLTSKNIETNAKLCKNNLFNRLHYLTKEKNIEWIDFELDNNRLKNKIINSFKIIQIKLQLEHNKRCICGHEIKYLFFIQNKFITTQPLILIGSCCIERFNEDCIFNDYQNFKNVNSRKLNCINCKEYYNKKDTNKKDIKCEDIIEFSCICDSCVCILCNTEIGEKIKYNKKYCNKCIEKCIKCGNKINEKYIYCYVCRKQNELSLLNKCVKCNKPIKSNFTKCYECFFYG